MPKTVLIVYHSNTCKTEKMTTSIVKGVEESGAKAVLRRVDECSVADLAAADALAVGSPTHYGNVAWQVKRFMDEKLLAFYSEGHSLKDKPCGCFTSTGGLGDGEECLRILERAFGVTLKMKIIPGLVLESTQIDGNLSGCVDFGRKIGLAAHTRV